MTRSIWPALALSLSLLTGCADVRLEFPDEEVPAVELNNLVEVEGSYCTSPAADVAYPVKIMFIVDGSGSQQFSDQNRQRVVAVEETINALIGQPNVYFKVIVFNASVTATPSIDATPVYSNDMSELVAALNTLAEADTVTDYQGALAVAYAEMKRDMDAIYLDELRGQAELGRTKYVNILISDGLPDPQCLAGLCNDIDPNFDPIPLGQDLLCEGLQVNRLCEDQSFLNCTWRVEGTVVDRTDANGNEICVYNDVECYCQDEGNMLFGGGANSQLAGGNDYNQPYQILQSVADVMELAETYELGELRLHSGLVLDPLVDPAVIEVFGDPAQAIPMMQQVAEIGQGQYLEFYGGDSINFVTINFDTLKQHRVVRDFYADNTAARGDPGEPSTDTDGDGLSDAEEFEIGSNSLSADTDEDGYNDFLEWKLRGYAFDFDDPCRPPIFDGSGAFTTTCGIEPGACDDDGSACTRDIECAEGAACVLGSCADDTGCGTAPYDRCYRGQCWSIHNCSRDGTGNFPDADTDGLHDCEERQLGTKLNSPDSDSDGIPDKLDLVLGLDPLHWDFDADTDQDGLPNGTEIEWHLDPAEEQSTMSVRERYRYSREFSGYAVDGRPCYDFVVKKIKLMQTGESVDREGLGVGYNKLMFYLSENMADSLGSTPVYRVSCIWTRWVPPNLKMPRSGELRLLEEDLYYLRANDPVFNDTRITPDRHFDPDTHCRQACSQSSDCDCENREVCWGGLCRPAGCCTENHCNDTQNCVQGQCLAPCPVGDECEQFGGGLECVEGHCLRLCSLDADCTSPTKCWDGYCSYFPRD